MNTEEVEKWWNETLMKFPREIIGQYSNLFGELNTILQCQITDRKLYQRRYEYTFNELERLKKEVKR